MRHLQGGSVNDHVINRHDVDIDQAINVVAVSIAVISAAQRSLDVMQSVKHGLRVQIAIKTQAYVHKPVLAIKPPGLTLNNPRHSSATATLDQSNDGAIEIIAPIANITTYIEVIFHVLRQDYKVL